MTALDSLLPHRRQLARGDGRDAPPSGGRTIGQLVRFGTIGVVSTVAYVLLYALFREWTSAAIANALALVVTAVGNTEANRRVTFGSGGDGLVRHQLAGLIAFAIALAITSGSIAGLHAAVAHPSRVAEIAVLVLANGVATLVRFVVLRRTVTPPRPAVAG